jgi:hypothetical protein
MTAPDDPLLITVSYRVYQVLLAAYPGRFRCFRRSRRLWARFGKRLGIQSPGVGWWSGQIHFGFEVPAMARGFKLFWPGNAPVDLGK